MNTRITPACVFVTLAFSFAMPSHGGLIGVDITTSGGSSGFATGIQNWGFKFNLTQAYTITSLGIWDARSNGDGLKEAHQVGLWNSSGTSLASVTVPSGTSGTYVESAAGSTVGGWRFTALTSSVTLDPGGYVLGAHYTTGSGGDPYEYALNLSTQYSTAPGLTVTEARYGGTAFGFPGSSDSGAVGGYFGPNFQATAVPEPSSLALMAVAVGGFGLIRRWRKKRLGPSGNVSSVTPG